MSVNIGWQGGIHVQSCGHYVHLTCLKAYILSLRNDAQHIHLLRTEKGTCRYKGMGKCMVKICLDDNY